MSATTWTCSRETSYITRKSRTKISRVTSSSISGTSRPRSLSVDNEPTASRMSSSKLAASARRESFAEIGMCRRSPDYFARARPHFALIASATCSCEIMAPDAISSRPRFTASMMYRRYWTSAMVASSGRSSTRCLRICFVEGCATPPVCHRPRSARPDVPGPRARLRLIPSRRSATSGANDQPTGSGGILGGAPWAPPATTNPPCDPVSASGRHRSRTSRDAPGEPLLSGVRPDSGRVGWCPVLAGRRFSARATLACGHG